QFVSTSCTGRDSDILSVQKFVDMFEENVSVLLKEIATQTLSIGMDVKNINKAFGYQFIDVIEPMLALNVDKVLDKLKDDFYYITTKLDGVRVLVKTLEKGLSIAYSRNGLILEGYDDFLLSLNLPHGYFFDGELMANISGNSQEKYKRTTEITRTKGAKPKDELVFHIFDIIPIDEFLCGGSKLDYSERRKQLDQISDTKYIEVVKPLMISPINEGVFSLLDKMTSEGEEGLMANLSTGKYECGKRSKNILKFKKFHTVDLRCLSVLEGEGAFKGTLGAIEVDYKGNIVKVGSGFTQEQRDYYWSNTDEIIGNIVEVQYFEETKNKKNNGLSLRFPIYLGVRTDKREVSYE
ncbi:MAG: hypothetical protein ACRCZ0_00090, partial [Cetobacterium sp.]